MHIYICKHMNTFIFVSTSMYLKSSRQYSNSNLKKKFFFRLLPFSTARRLVFITLIKCPYFTSELRWNILPSQPPPPPQSGCPPLSTPRWADSDGLRPPQGLGPPPPGYSSSFCARPPLPSTPPQQTPTLIHRA